MSETKIDGAKLRCRIETPFTNEHFANYCLKMVGQPYWYGTCGYRATEDLLQRKAKQYPSSYPASRMKRYRQDIANHAVVADCIGGAKGYAWTGGGESILAALSDKNIKITSKYGSNGCPDKGANSMLAYAKSKGMDRGKITDLPEIVGLALHTDGHVGYYVGNGCAVEWRGFNYGCVKTKVKDRSWKYWYKLPFIKYDEEINGSNCFFLETDSHVKPSLPVVNYTRLLKKDINGSDVRDMQEILLVLKYSLPCYGADGKFGNETMSAVKAFQREKGLKADGIYGPLTHAAMCKAVSEL